MSPMLMTSASARGSTTCHAAVVKDLEAGLLILEQHGDGAGIGVLIHTEVTDCATEQSPGRSGVGHFG